MLAGKTVDDHSDLVIHVRGGGGVVTSSAPAPEALRRRAEVLAWQEKSPPGGPGETGGPDALAQTLYELRVHQIELEMQNEELRQFQLDLDASRERFFDFYDMAPLGYCTVNDKGTVIEANLTTAKLLGVPRDRLIKQPFTRFIEPADQDVFYLMRKQLLQTKAVQTCELRLRQNEGEPVWVNLMVRTAPTADQGSVMRIVLSEIAERKRMQAEVLAAKRNEEQLRRTLSGYEVGLRVDVTEPNQAGQDSVTKLPKRALLGEHRSSTLLFLLVGVLSTLLLAIGSLGLFGIRQSNDALKTVYEDRTVAIGLLSDVQHQLMRSRSLIGISLFDPRPQVIAVNLPALRNTSELLSKTWAAYMATSLNQEEKKLAAKFALDHRKFEQEALQPAMAALRANDMAGAQGLMRDRLVPLEIPLQLGLDGLMQIQLSVAKQEYQLAVDRYATVRLISMSAIGVGVLFAILTGLAVLRSRRQELTVALERHAHADLERLLEEKNHLMQALTESEFRWKFAIEGAGDGVWDNNLQTGEESYSRRWKEMLGYAEHEILPNHQEWEIRIHPDDRQAVLASSADYIAGKTANYEPEYRLRCKDGSYKWILSRGMIVSRDPSGKPLRTIGTHTDITERKRIEEQLRSTEALFRESIDTLNVSFAVYDSDDRLVLCNKLYSSYRSPAGWTVQPASNADDSDLYGRTFEEILRLRAADGQYPIPAGEEDQWIAERLLEHRQGNLDVVREMSKGLWIKVIDQRTPSGYVVGLRFNVTELCQAKQAAETAHQQLEEKHQELERIARYDSLTKLPNRALLGERLEQALNQTLRRGQQLAVVFIDLDGFKAVNDTHGHEAGDHLLITLAERMKGALRDGDILARLGGDEFVAVLLDLADVDASAPMLNRLLDAAARPFQFGQARLQVSASLGVTFYPQSQGQQLEPDQLLRQADQAMYQAKQAGKNRFHVFDVEQDRNVRARHESMQSIERALSEGEFVLQYQPKVNLRTGAVIGVEALIRWLHPQRGLLPPSDFLPMIEDHPLAVKLGQWVIESALAQMERWRGVGLNMPVSVNVGRRHLMQAGFADQLREALAAHPALQPNCLEIELLETSAIKDMNHVSQVI